MSGIKSTLLSSLLSAVGLQRMLFIGLVFFVEINISSAAPDNIVVIEHGKSNYEIVMENEASLVVRQAGLELQRLIKKSTGVNLSIVSAPDSGKHQIYVGNSRYIGPDILSRLSAVDDAFIIAVKSSDVYLLGIDDASNDVFDLGINRSASVGSYFSVLSFARRYLGAEWYMPGDTGEEIAIISDLSLPSNLDLREQPRFKIRYVDVASYVAEKNIAKAVKQDRLKKNTYNVKLHKETSLWGRRLMLGNNFELDTGHAWYKWIPAEKPTKYSHKAYGKLFPEYFAEPGGRFGRYYYGKGNSHGGQLCMCNPGVSDEMANNIIAYARQTGARSFSLSPNDSGKWDCRCACCKEKNLDKNASGGRLTGELIKFSNQVAEKVKKEIPDARFGLYAYSWASEPPADLQVDPSIAISDVYNGLAYQFYLPRRRAKIEKNINLWRSRSDQVVLTSYYTFYGHYGFPWSSGEVYDWLLKNLDKYEASQGARINLSQYDVAPIGSLGADPWILARLLWNPQQPLEDLKNEYYNGAFGDQAGPLIKEYFEKIGLAMRNAIANERYKNARGVKRYIETAYPEIRKECDNLLSQARISLKNAPDRYSKRLEKIELGWKYAGLVLDLIHAERQRDLASVKRFQAELKALKSAEHVVFSFGRSASDLQQSVVPLIGNSR